MQKIKMYRPKVVAFNGRGIYEVYAGNKHFHYGKQPELFPETDTVRNCALEFLPSTMDMFSFSMFLSCHRRALVVLSYHAPKINFRSMLDYENCAILLMEHCIH